MTIGVVLALWVVFGAVGAFLGSMVGKGGTGFLLGILLGPIGWIIVLLLPRESQQSDNSNSSQQNLRKTLIEQPSRSSRPERDLTSDAYKIWLVETYEIKKNDVFEKYVCNETLFETLDDALVYADSLEAEKRSSEEIEAEKERVKKAQEEQDKGHPSRAAEEWDSQKTESEKKLASSFSWIAGGVVVLSLLTISWLITTESKRKESLALQEKVEREIEEERRREVEERRTEKEENEIKEREFSAKQQKIIADYRSSLAKILEEIREVERVAQGIPALEKDLERLESERKKRIGDVNQIAFEISLETSDAVLKIYKRQLEVAEGNLQKTDKKIASTKQQIVDLDPTDSLKRLQDARQNLFWERDAKLARLRADYPSVTPK